MPDLSLLDSLRLWFARYWHILATAYLVVGYGIAALGVRDGFVLMLRGTIVTLAILVGMRFLFHASDRWGANDTGAAAAVHHAILRFLLRLVTWVFAGLGVAAAWGVNLPALFATPLGQRVLGGAFSIGATVIVIALIYEGCNSAIERRLYRRDAEGKVIPASARVRTCCR
jgi:small conductance mechanosensitive channel